MRCPKCGNELEPGAVFCGNCGNKIETVRNYVIGGTFCPKCGATLDSGARFCGECGFHLDNVNTGREKVSREAKEENSKDKGLMVLLAVLAAVILVCIAVFGFIFLGNSSDVLDTPRPERKAKQTDIEKGSHKKTEKKYEEKEEEPVEEEDPEYLFESDTKYITERDLLYLSQEEVALIRNEIYARHGYIFRTESYKLYFESKSWYIPDPDFSEDMFNSIEKANKDFIVEYEKRMGWRK